ARVTREELLERFGAALEEDFRQTARRHHAAGIAITAGILGRNQPLLSREADEQRATLAQERLCEALVVFALAQVSAQAQLVVKLVGVARIAAQLSLDVLDSIRVEQVAQLFLPQQLAQEDEVELARAQPLQQPLQRGQVEDVLQALAIGLEDDWERAVAARDLKQSLRLEALLPQRRALVRAATRDQQRAGCVLAETRAEKRALPHLLHDELLDLVRRDQDLVGRRRRIGIRQMQRDAVVRPDRLHLEPERLAEPGGEGKRPRSVHARAERRQDAEP